MRRDRNVGRSRPQLILFIRWIKHFVLSTTFRDPKTPGPYSLFHGALAQRIVMSVCKITLEPNIPGGKRCADYLDWFASTGAVHTASKADQYNGSGHNEYWEGPTGRSARLTSGRICRVLTPRWAHTVQLVYGAAYCGFVPLTQSPIPRQLLFDFIFSRSIRFSQSL